MLSLKNETDQCKSIDCAGRKFICKAACSRSGNKYFKEPIAEINSEQPTLENNFKEIVSEIHDIESTLQETAPIYEQQNLEQLDSHFLTKDARKNIKSSVSYSIPTG